MPNFRHDIPQVIKMKTPGADSISTWLLNAPNELELKLLNNGTVSLTGSFQWPPLEEALDANQCIGICLFNNFKEAKKILDFTFGTQRFDASGSGLRCTCSRLPISNLYGLKSTYFHLFKIISCSWGRAYVWPVAKLGDSKFYLTYKWPKILGIS